MDFEKQMAIESARSVQNPVLEKEVYMLSWSLAFLVIAVIAALFGFTGIAVGAASIAKILFVVFLALAVLAFLVQALRGRPPV